LHILSAKTEKPEKKCLDGSSGAPTTFGDYSLEVTLANVPTNGAYLFDVFMQFGNGLKQIVRIKIQKRKVEINFN
jgi:hypothetical protein